MICAAKGLCLTGRPSVLCKGSAKQREDSGIKRILGLKEWAVNIEALSQGDQTVEASVQICILLNYEDLFAGTSILGRRQLKMLGMILLRKGGIRESGFKLLEEEFFLIPNTFHSNAALLKPSAEQNYAKVLATPQNSKEGRTLGLRVWARVTGVWTTSNLTTLQRLDKFHIWNDAYLQNRLAFRSKQPVTVLELQCSNLPEELEVENQPSIWGCFSFAELPQLPENRMRDLKPIIPQEVFWEKQKGIRTELCRAEVHCVFC